jgi:hypothetical protein
MAQMNFQKKGLRFLLAYEATRFERCFAGGALPLDERKHGLAPSLQI